MVITTSPVHIKHPPKIWFNRRWVHIFGAIRWECLILDGILWGWHTNVQKVHVIQITPPNFFSWFFEVEMLILESAQPSNFAGWHWPSVVPKKINTCGMSHGPKRIRWSWFSFETIDGHLVRYATPVRISQQKPRRTPHLSMKWYIVFTNYGSLPFVIYILSLFVIESI